MSTTPIKYHKTIDNVLKSPAVLIPLLYIFVAVIPHTIALRYVLATAMLLILIYQLCRGQLQKPPINIASLSLFGLCATTVLSAFVSPYMAESLSELKKETLPFLVTFLLLVCQPLKPIQRERVSKYTIMALIAGFAMKLGLAIWDGVENGLKFSIYDYASEEKPPYLDFFAADIIYFMPFLLGTIFFLATNVRHRVLLAIITTLTVVFSFNSGVRTTFVFVCGSILFFVFCRFWNYKRTIFILLAMCIGTSFFAKSYLTSPLIQRYSSILSPQTYKFGVDGSITERTAIAKSVWEINKERFWLGYGPGWKKLPTVASENAHLQRWEAETEPWHRGALNYFSLGAGRVNPHNFYLMVMFETGVIGLVAYLLFMLGLACHGLRFWFNSTLPLPERGLGFTVFVYIAVYLGAGLAGGPWLPVSLLVAAVSIQLSIVPARNQFIEF